MFQSRGPAVANDRSPTVTHRDGRTLRRQEVDERRRPRRLVGRSATYCSWSDKYRVRRHEELGSVMSLLLTLCCKITSFFTLILFQEFRWMSYVLPKFRVDRSGLSFHWFPNEAIPRKAKTCTYSFCHGPTSCPNLAQFGPQLWELARKKLPQLPKLAGK